MDNFTNICEATSQSHELDNHKPTHRKGKKLLAEKKRRARINNCLLQIRNIVCEGEDDKDTDLEKMEKAEILEKTLEVLTRLRHDYSSPTSSSYSTRKAMAVRYASGFSSCAEESIRYIQNSHLVPTEVKVQLQAHLRTIARRMEAGLQEDSKDVNFTQSYPTSPQLSSPSSSMMSGRLTTTVESTEEIYRSDMNRGQMSEVGSYTPSPIHFSTPIAQSHMPVSSTFSQSNQQEFISETPQTFIKSDFIQKESKHTEYISSEMISLRPQNVCLNKEVHSSYTVSSYSHPEVSSTGCERDNQYNTSLLSPNTSYSPSNQSSTNETPLSRNAPIILYPAPVLQTTSPFSDQPVFSYVYESYPSCSVPSILVQPVTYISTPVRQTMAAPAVHKQPSTPNNALDLCVKRGQVHQISPETMWRPW